MTYDRDKLLGYLAALEAGEAGADAAYGAFLDQLPAQFGSPKLAHEADLILAMLAAAELARAAAVSAEGPVRFEALPDDGSGGQARFRPVAFAPVGGVDAEWRGVPLQVLASVLDRSRAPQSADDEEYAAGFVYVLFRLKAALGVWRGDGAPSARYRLWLKDLAPVIARHPRLGPKVVDGHRRIVEALSAEAEALKAAVERKERVEMSAIFRFFGPFADQHVSLAGEDLATREDLNNGLWHCSLLAFERAELQWSVSARGCLVRWSGGQVGAAASAAQLGTVAGAYMNRGNASQAASGHGPIAAIGDYDRAIEIQADLRQTLEPTGDWAPALGEALAMAYTNRGNARRDIAGHGAVAAIGDYERAIKIQEDLRRTLESIGAWTASLRESLANTYMNRGVARQNAVGHGPAAAVGDFNRAVEIRENLHERLERTGDWTPSLRETLAMAYSNRGVARQNAAGHGPAAAISDYERAIEIRENIRQWLEPTGDWAPPLREALATTYMNRGTARYATGGLSASAVIKDYDAAIEIQEGLRRTLEPNGDWAPSLRESLAMAYVNRGTSKQSAVDGGPAAGHDPAAATKDYDRAIETLDDLRRTLEPIGAWTPSLQETLAVAYTNRGNGTFRNARHGPAAAIGDYDRAIGIREDLRRTLEPIGGWLPRLGESLAMALFNRCLCRKALSAFPTALEDALQTSEIVGVMIDAIGAEAIPPLWIRIRDAARSQINDLKDKL